MIRSLRKITLTADEIIKREKVIKEQGSFNELVEYKSFEGHSFFVEATVKLLKNPGVDYYLYIITPLDKSFFETIFMCIVIVNKAHEIITVNPFYCSNLDTRNRRLLVKRLNA